MLEQEGAEAGLTGAGHTFSSDSLGVAARNPSKRRTPGLERVSRPVSYDCPEVFMGEQSMHLLPFPMGAITQIDLFPESFIHSFNKQSLSQPCARLWGRSGNAV